MKKTLFFCLLYFITINVFARSCPPANQVVYRGGDGVYHVAPPAGWKLSEDKRHNKYNKDYVFRVAAWGDHKHPTDNVRCYYYDASGRDYGHIQIETIDFFDKSHVASWHDNNDPLYALCVSRSDDVSQCSFK